MREDIRKFAKLGLVHHLLYPRCTVDPDYHLRTLLEFAARKEIEVLDCCVPYGEERRKKAISALKDCGKEITYAMHLFPLRKISLGSTCPQEQGLARLVIKDQIEVAAAAGAARFIFASGADMPRDRPSAKKAFSDFCRWFCPELKLYGMTALLEPFDRTFDKKYLYGPTSECVELIESLKPEVDNLALELDVAHLPLMHESFPDAFQTAGPNLKYVHLGNCIKKDASHPWCGDFHPPIGIDGGEIDIPELAGILRICLDIGYLNAENRGRLVLEMQPFPGKTVDETVQDNLQRLEKAWKLV